MGACCFIRPTKPGTFVFFFNQQEHRPRGSAARQSAGANGRQDPAPDGWQEEVLDVVPIHAQYRRGERVFRGGGALQG